MDYSKLCSESQSIVDMSSLLEKFQWGEEGYIIAGEKGCGKSTILSMMYYYFSAAEDSRQLFSDKQIACETDWDSQLNSRPVILFSFEGLFADTYEKMTEQIFNRVRKQCLEYVPGGSKYEKSFDGKIYTENFLNIVEGKCKNIQDSLNTLIWTERNTHRPGAYNYPLVLLDEPFWPLEQARKYDYENELCAFMQKFLDGVGSFIEKKLIVTEFPPENYNLKIWDTFNRSVYDRPKGFFLTREEILEHAGQLMQTNACKLSRENAELLDNGPLHFAKNKLAYENASRFPWEQRKLKTADVPSVNAPVYPVSYIEKLAGIEMNNLEDYDDISSIVLPDKVTEFVNEERRRIEDKYREWRRHQIAEQRKEKRQYRKPLPDGVLIPTEFLGIRKLPAVIRTPEYKALNSKLKEFYQAWEKEPEWDGLYRYMQKFDGKQCTDWDRSSGKIIKEYIRPVKNQWHSISWDDGGCWGQLIVQKREQRISSEHIKIYASTGNTCVKEMFLGAVKELFSHAENSFAAKVSKYMRKESMCFWVRRADLGLLENYFTGWSDALIENLDFIAYRGKLGYSRETYNGDSHNQWQAELMKGYFRKVSNADKLKLTDMYQYLIDSWNYEIRRDDSIAPEFKAADAQILIILLETFFIKIKNRPFDDDNILLSDNKNWWEPLCLGRNWYEVGNCYLEMQKTKV